MGMILSPVYVCLVVTAEHFKTDVSRVIRNLLAPASVVIAGIFILHLVYRVLF